MSFTIEEINTKLVKVSEVDDGQYFYYDGDDEISPGAVGYWMKCNYTPGIGTGEVPVKKSYVLNMTTFDMREFKDVFTGREAITRYKSAQFDVHFVPKQEYILYDAKAMEKGNLIMYNGSVGAMHIVTTMTDFDHYVVININTGMGFRIAQACVGASPNLYIVGYDGNKIDLYLSIS